MNRRGAAFAVIAFAAAAAWQLPVNAQRTEPVAEVRVPSNLRVGPSMGERVLKVLPRGARVLLLGQSGAWSHVRHVDRRTQPIEGWIVTRLLVIPAASPIAPKPAQAPTQALPEQEPGHYLVQVLVPMLAVYDGPDSAQPVIARIEQGARFEADSRRGDWFRLRLGGERSGWVRDKGDDGAALAVQSFPQQNRVEYPDAGAAQPPIDAGRAVNSPDAVAPPRIVRARPQGAPLAPAPAAAATR